MTKNELITNGMIVILGVALIGTIVSFKGQVADLNEKLVQSENNLTNQYYAISNRLNTFETEIKTEIQKGASLLAQMNQKATFGDDKVEITITVLPKEIANDEKLYLEVQGVTYEMKPTKNLQYVATFELPKNGVTVPSVIFESSSGVRREALSELNAEQLLSINYESVWTIDVDTQKSPLQLNLYVFDSMNVALLDKISSPIYIVKDGLTDTEIASVETTPSANGSPSAKQLDGKSYEADLKQYIEKPGTYKVIAVVETSLGFKYEMEIASFEYSSADSFGNSSGAGMMIPIW